MYRSDFMDREEFWEKERIVKKVENIFSFLSSLLIDWG